MNSFIESLIFCNLRGRITEKEGQTEREGSSIHWFTPNMASVPGMGQAEVRSLRLQLGLPCGEQRPKYLGSILLLFQEPYEGRGSGSGRNLSQCSCGMLTSQVVT